MSELSHLDSEGRARMVDVGGKIPGARLAIATGRLHTTAEVVGLVRADDLPKADVLATARLAGIMGAKKTSELIPLCHQIPLSSVRLRFDYTDTTINIEATAETVAATGVEMEALTAVAIAGLTLHDMVKAVDPGATLTDVQLQRKEGGKRGVWQRDHSQREPCTEFDAGPRSAAVLVSSTSVAAGTRADTTGTALVEWLTGLGFAVHGPLIYPDARITEGLAEALAPRPALVVTTGGTGASPTDRTPEATAAVLDRQLPGIAQAIRDRGAQKVPTAALSRGLAGLSGTTVVINLPGSPGGVKDGIAVLEPMLDHLLAQVAGGGSHE